MDPAKSSVSLPREDRDAEKASNLSIPGEDHKDTSRHTSPGPVTHTPNQASNLGDEKAVVQTNEPTVEYLQGMAQAPVILALVLSVFIFAIDLTIVGTAIPKITDEFHGLDQVSWYGAAYFMTYGAFQPAMGKVFKYFPLKPSFLISLFLFMVGSLICALAKNSTTLIVGRAIAGLAAAGVGTGVFTIVGLEIHPKQRPGYLGLIGGIYGISAVLGPILGGVFTTRITWRWCFWINLPIGGASCLLILIFLKDLPQAKGQKATWKERLLQSDPVGIALIMGAIISFTLAFQYGGQTMPWSDSKVIGLIVGFGAITIVFVIWEVFNQRYAMFPGYLLSQRYMWSCCLEQCFLAAGYFVFLYYVPIYFQSVHNTTAIRSGVLNLPAVCAVVVGNIISGTVVSKTGQAWPCLFIGTLLASIGSGLVYMFDIGTPQSQWIGFQFLYGFGAGLAWQMTQNILQVNTKPEDMSTATSTILFFQVIGGAFSVDAAQAGFINRIIGTLAKSQPSITPQQVIITGATSIRESFPANQIRDVVLAYVAGLKVSFIIIIALTCFACVISFVVPFKRLDIGALTGGGGAA